MTVYGDVLTAQEGYIDFPSLKRILERPVVQPRFRISVLNSDETVNYIIPESDIPNNGISYTEEYHNGQRRNISLQLINKNGKYTPSINRIWFTTKFGLEVGIATSTDITWFPKGVYVVGSISLTENGGEETVSIQLKDKYSLFEGKTGTLEEAHEIQLNSLAVEVLQGVLNFSRGDGTIFDPKPVFLDSSLINFRTQATIRVDEGGNLGQVIDALATQMSAEYYYNSVGNLCFYPINETIDDSNKPTIWVFKDFNSPLHNLNLSYMMEEIINVSKVVGDNIDKEIYSAIEENNNPASPICIQRIGRRATSNRSENNVWSDEIAHNLAKYYLRQSSFVTIDFSCEIGYNPFLVVNNIIEVEDKFLNLQREKLLLTSISYSSDTGAMSLKLCNTKDLPNFFNA